MILSKTRINQYLNVCLFQGIIYLVRHNVLEDSVVEIAKFINCTGALYGKSVREYLNTR